jgi:hypothetical protein
MAQALADLAVQVVEVEMHGLRVLDAMLRGRPGVVAKQGLGLAGRT